MTLREQLRNEIGNVVCIGTTSGSGFIFIGKVDDYDRTCEEIEHTMDLLKWRKNNTSWVRVTKDYKTRIDMRNRTLLHFEECSLDLKGLDDVLADIDERIADYQNRLDNARETKSKQRYANLLFNAKKHKLQIQADKLVILEELKKDEEKMRQYAYTLKNSRIYMKKLNDICGDTELVLDSMVVDMYPKILGGKAIIVNGNASGYWFENEKEDYWKYISEREVE